MILYAANTEYLDQQLADRYAPGNSDISTTLAALQIPPDLHVQTPERATFVPLPSRRPTGSKQQTAEAIRDGRRASQRIASLRGWVPTSESGGRSTTGSANSTMRTSHRGTSATTILEQDFTVPGKVSKLECPFASKAIGMKPPNEVNFDDPNTDHGINASGSTLGLSPHCPADPICSAMYSDTHSSAPASVTGSAKCPIRFLDQHSPEEVAQYFETHKHEIPRSHEICVKRYQRNEDDIRKLDAKYGNIVSMIQGLGAKHQPMLASNEIVHDEVTRNEEDRNSNERVEDWAKAVSSDGVDDSSVQLVDTEKEQDRQSRFDRSLRDVRVGESPSRPWGIQVPYTETPDLALERAEFPRPGSPPPAPVYMPPPQQEQANPQTSPAAPGRPAGRCPFGHDAPETAEPSPAKSESPKARTDHDHNLQPIIVSPHNLNNGKPGPQMVFSGPVFIGYPLDQAMLLMKQWQQGTGENR